jgi:hypothetical protein
MFVFVMCVCSSASFCVGVCWNPGGHTWRNHYVKGHHEAQCLSAIKVDTPSEPFVVCQDSTASSVDVIFTARTSNGDSIRVPETITASDGRVCRAQGSTKDRESDAAAASLQSTICYPHVNPVPNQ